ncbi:MAG: tRNA preQ1(34) S-adenosylmethionine ribosyltransferase-isomerase QueA [Planctomycetia bacterium]|nr:tRNA preQ1(34) S-adenosylmethionine ribosyltransferase-isomerase QueA [Planctomycetia bacterium]
MNESIELKQGSVFSEEMLLLSSYDYELPPRLIAQSPTVHREDARLMFIDRQTNSIRHLFIRDFPSLLQPNDAIVLNNTKVLPARLIGFRTATQGQWEGLFLRFLPNGNWEIMSKTRGKLRKGETITLELPKSNCQNPNDFNKSKQKNKYLTHKSDNFSPIIANKTLKKQSETTFFKDYPENANVEYYLEIVERTEEKTLIVKPILQKSTFLPDLIEQNSLKQDILTTKSDGSKFNDFANGTHPNVSPQGSHSEAVLSDFFPHSNQLESSLLFLEKVGWVPIPPYIRAGRMIPSDRNDYQTVFAQEPGAVAAPTAGLHFSEEMLETIRQSGVAICSLTLHVGAGTFKPISAKRLDEHQMHSEFASISDETVKLLKERRQKGGRIIAIGTTSVRTLESASNCDSEGNIDSTGQNDFSLNAFRGYTNLFIRPPYRFKSVDAMLTNFHLPKSTLLVLVRTFGGNELLKKAYRDAIEQEYRFYSYGDAMIIF